MTPKLWITEVMVGERSIQRRSMTGRACGADGRENAGVSSEMQVGILHTDGPRSPGEGSSSLGESGPKARPRGVADGRLAEIPVPHAVRRSDGDVRLYRVTEYPGQARQAGRSEMRARIAESARHTESCGKYGNQRSVFQEKLLSPEPHGPVPKMDTHGQGENPEVSERTAAKELCKMTP